MSKQAICPLCVKSCGPHRPGAKVYHMSCLEARFKALREKWAKEREETIKTFQIWAEAAQCQGHHGFAPELIGKQDASTFEEACRIRFKGDKLFTENPLMHYGCRLFPNEDEAYIRNGEAP